MALLTIEAGLGLVQPPTKKEASINRHGIGWIYTYMILIFMKKKSKVKKYGLQYFFKEKQEDCEAIFFKNFEKIQKYQIRIRSYENK